MFRRITLIAAIILMLIPGSQAIGQDSSDSIVFTHSGYCAEEGTWEIQITVPSREYQPGAGLTVAIEFTINSVGLSHNVSRINGIYSLITGSRIFNGDGEMIGRTQALGSTRLTGVGLPVECQISGLPTDRFGGDFHHPIDSYDVLPASSLNIDTTSGTISGTIMHNIQLDESIPTGWYQLRVDLGLEIQRGDIVTLWGVDPDAPATTEDEQTYAVTDPIAIGTTSQPQLIWTLFSSSLPSGGVVAVEDEGYIGLSRRLGTSDTTILPMMTASGRQITYSMEPDFVLVYNDFIRSGGQILNLDYRSGWMEARIENPDGTIIDLGGASFNGRRGYGATTLQDKFAFSFSQYGRHRIELSGWIRDSSNQTYVGGGVYEVYVAKPIDIETNVLNGMPFYEDEYCDPGFQLYPPVPADVEITWELDPKSRRDSEVNDFTVRANRWGYYSPPIPYGRDRFSRSTQIFFYTPGEYKVSFVAKYEEEDGTLWMGEKTIAGVVVPDDPIEVLSRPPASGSFSITSDARYVPVPADSGNTVLMPVDSNPSLPTIYTFPLGFMLGDLDGIRIDDAALLELNHVTTGTFVTPRLASSTGLFPALYPDDIDRYAYLIAAASRNDGCCQFYVGEGAANLHLPYSSFPWIMGELAPDAAGDYYHIWGSVVYRDIASETALYGYYSSAIVLDDSISTPRLHQDSSPVISDGWGERDLFMHNLAVEPGTIMDEGAIFTPAAYYLPLPDNASVQFIVTPPMGDQIIINLDGDNRGYAQDMSERFELFSRGVWQVESRVIIGEETGSLLGVSGDAPWVFYVIDGGNRNPIDFHMPEVSELDLVAPELVLIGDLNDCDISEGTVFVSATFNSAIIEQTERVLTNGSFTYSIDIDQIPNSFPNYNPFSPSDRLVLTFFIEGMTSTGSRQMAAKTIYIQGGQVYTGEKDYKPIDPQSRDEWLDELINAAERDAARELRGRGVVGTN